MYFICSTTQQDIAAQSRAGGWPRAVRPLPKRPGVGGRGKVLGLFLRQGGHRSGRPLVFASNLLSFCLFSHLQPLLLLRSRLAWGLQTQDAPAMTVQQ